MRRRGVALRRRAIPFAAQVAPFATAALATLVAVAVAGPVAAQELAGRIAAAPADATVRFSFDARPGVCGNGDNLMVRNPEGSRRATWTDGGQTFNTGTGGDGWTIENCEEGPVRIELQRSGREVTRARARVGGTDSGSAVELGHVSVGAAVDYLLGQGLRSSSGRAAGRMVFAATLADTETWPRLLEIAHDRDMASRARNSAIFWLAHEAGERAAAGLVSVIGDDSDEMDVRKHAVFALSQLRGDAAVDALIEVARTNREPALRKTAMFWLGQSKSERAIAFFEEVLRGTES